MSNLDGISEQSEVYDGEAEDGQSPEQNTLKKSKLIIVRSRSCRADVQRL
jgi:hypothetical protein